VPLTFLGAVSVTFTKCNERRDGPTISISAQSLLDVLLPSPHGSVRQNSFRLSPRPARESARRKAHPRSYNSIAIDASNQKAKRDATLFRSECRNSNYRTRVGRLYLRAPAPRCSEKILIGFFGLFASQNVPRWESI
jgi:hypothetical protein